MGCWPIYLKRSLVFLRSFFWQWEHAPFAIPKNICSLWIPSCQSSAILIPQSVLPPPALQCVTQYLDWCLEIAIMKYPLFEWRGLSGRQLGLNLLFSTSSFRSLLSYFAHKPVSAVSCCLIAVIFSFPSLHHVDNSSAAGRKKHCNKRSGNGGPAPIYFDKALRTFRRMSIYAWHVKNDCNFEIVMWMIAPQS